MNSKSVYFRFGVWHSGWEVADSSKKRAKTVILFSLSWSKFIECIFYWIHFDSMYSFARQSVDSMTNLDSLSHIDNKNKLMALQVNTIIYATCESSSQIDQLNMWPVRVKSSHKIFNRSFLFKILSYTIRWKSW